MKRKKKRPKIREMDHWKRRGVDGVSAVKVGRTSLQILSLSSLLCLFTQDVAERISATGHPGVGEEEALGPPNYGNVMAHA